ncbi:carboxymuconolactone decarboxylase family protein [Mesobacillus maritimus]|uniref:carboxymuconolactone decarboxylase family protein n=1 Tax=Mesobacillus maritimus TaxID=1643336 RepID=UPI0020403D21|nr:carboxymuconolactone decarboxylase family protein [Mesobacillus maritimus]MCM3587857.1 carboxymuconolactone decarboxylase family protein [Mesobacillus maritimus]MCM3671786.1 carboxymuconolactone decarboxylase family protein [Mesobacillus maritimus]
MSRLEKDQLYNAKGIGIDDSKKTQEASFKEEVGYWNSTLNYLLDADEEFFEIYKKLVSTPYKNNILDAKSRELINIALSSAPTNLSKDTLETHIENALNQGATEKEILEVFKLVSVLGMHTCAVGVPILVEETGQYEGVPLNRHQEELKQKFVEKMGYWHDFRNTLLLNDEHFFESYYEFLTNPWETDILSPKLKEFIYIAIDSATTHLFDVGIRVHIRGALKHGATFEEIMEVLKLTSAQGVDTFYAGIPVLESVLAKRGK